jgi:DNA-binding transcriptional MerR regulator
MTDLGSDIATDHPYRMKDLCELTGLPRQAIHFYIQQGLLPKGRKTGRNMAWYGDEHVERLRLIRKLQHERFLPLKAIKALLDGREDRFSGRQQAFLRDLKRELRSTLARDADTSRTLVDVTSRLDELEITREDVRELVDNGVLNARIGEDGRVEVAEDDLWMLEHLAKTRGAGFTRDLGFTPADMAFYVEMIDAMLERDAKLLSERLSDLPPVVAARMIERAIPILHEFHARDNASRVRDFFATIESNANGDEP